MSKKMKFRKLDQTLCPYQAISKTDKLNCNCKNLLAAAVPSAGRYDHGESETDTIQETPEPTCRRAAVTATVNRRRVTETE
jgi:hypothetical protein